MDRGGRLPHVAVPDGLADGARAVLHPLRGRLLSRARRHVRQRLRGAHADPRHPARACGVPRAAAPRARVRTGRAERGDGMRLVVAALALLAVAAPAAQASESTQTFRYGPIHIAPYGMDERDYVSGMPGPQVDGYLTGGRARIVDAQGGPVSQARVMLHHLVFSNAGARLGERLNPTCDRIRLFDSLAEVPGLSEPVAGFAEEHVDERLPAGHRSPIRSGDRWVGTWMLMNHRSRPETVYLEYQATVVTGERLTPAYPLWLDVGGCGLDPLFDVPGGGRRGSTFTRSITAPAPFTGRI